MQRRQPGYNPDELPVEDLLAFGRLKDESHDLRAINAWADYEKHGDKSRLNRDIQEVVRQSRETGPMPAAVPAPAVAAAGAACTAPRASPQPTTDFCGDTPHPGAR